MKFYELENLVKGFVNNKELSDNQKKSLASNIKRQFNIKLQEYRIKGNKISFNNLKKLINPLIKNYDYVKDYNTINEFIQIISKEMENASNNKNAENEIEKIHTVILGYPGTTTEGMSSEYISKIIRQKLTENDGINREDIINILSMQSKNMYMNLEEYQKLINDSVIAYLSNNPRGQRFLNPKILSIFGNLAASYKVQENYEEALKIYKKGLRITALRNTPEYIELNKKYDEFLNYLEMLRNFEDRRFDSFENLMKSLKTKFTNQQIFKKGTNQREQRENDDKNPNEKRTIYIMPTELRLEGIKRLVNALKRDNKDYDIVECEVGKDVYDGYVIIKIKGTNVSIFENFNEETARLYVVKNEVIDKVKELAKNEAISLDGVEGVNHVENFDHYCRNLIAKTRRAIRETQIGLNPPNEEELRFLDEEIVDIDTELTTSKDVSEIEIIKENNNDETKGDKEENDDDIKNQEEMEKEKDKTNIEEPISEIEIERQKAHKNREYLKQLEAEIERIQRESNEKIAEIKRKMEELTNGDEQQ